MIQRLYLLSLLCLTYTMASGQCDDDRYRNFNYFEGSTVTEGIQFGVNESVPPFGSTEGTPQVLGMDVYEPAGDTLAERPVVLVAFGGSFIGGERSQVEFLCREFARLGYVAVAPDYRVGLFFPINEVQTTLAVLRGAHDMKGCVRYLRQTVAENGNPYRIDPDMVFVGGVSAGAISAIHAAYLDDIATEIPEYLVNDTAGLGGLEGLSGPMGYSSDVQGVFSYSGAIGDTSWIEEFDTPIISFHEEGDPTVPYLTQEVSVSGFPTGLIASGSFDLHVRAANANLDHCMNGYPGTGHVGFLGNGNYEEVLGKTADFLADILCDESVDCGLVDYELPCAVFDATIGTQTPCDTTTQTYTQELTLEYVNAPTSGTITVNGVEFDVTGSPQTVVLTDLPANGQLVEVEVSFSDNEFCENIVDESWTAPVCISTGILEQIAANIQVYPMPATDQIVIDASEVQSKLLGWRISDIMGRPVVNGLWSSNKISVDVSDYPAGHYMLSLWDGNGMVNKKLLIH